MAFAANEYLAPVEARAQELGCVPSWADACSTVEVAISDDQLMIHVPNGGFPPAAVGRKPPRSSFRSSSAWRSGATTSAAQPIDADRISVPTAVASGPALAGLRVLSSATGGVCASTDTPGCVDVTNRWLAASDTTAQPEEDEDDDPCVVNDGDEDDEGDERSLEQRAVAEDDSSDVVPCAALLPAGSTGSLLNPITFLLPIPPVIGILAGGDGDPAPPTGGGDDGGLDGGDDEGGDGGSDGGSDGGTDAGTTGGTDGGDDGGTTGGGTRTIGGDDDGTDGGSDGGNDDGGTDDGGNDGGGNDDGGNDDGGNDDGGNDDGGNDDGADDWPTDDGGGTPPMSEVPEPVTTTLMGLGLASWAAARARQRRKGSELDPGEAEDPLD
jgi:hypothetical protein